MMKPSGPGPRPASLLPPPPPPIQQRQQQLPPPPPVALRSWCIASSVASAISYADRGTSAVTSSQLLHELHWTEGQLGGVQGSFYAGYAITQVLGGLLGGGRGGLRGRRGGRRRRDVAINAAEGSSSSSLSSTTSSRNDGEDEEESDGRWLDEGGGEEPGGYYRAILPLSLALTAIATLLFPLSAERGGPILASFDRFCLGLFEGLLLPAAMAGVSDVAAAAASTTTKTKTKTTTEVEEEGDGDPRDEKQNNVATASSVVIAGCYLGSAWAYLSAWVLFSERFQTIASDWTSGEGHHAAAAADGGHLVVWPWVFYLNGIVSLVCLFLFRDEFDFSFPFVGVGRYGDDVRDDYDLDARNAGHDDYDDDDDDDDVGDLRKDAISIAKATFSSRSGRAIIMAQMGQGALLYSIASWGPLYLERVGAHVVEPVDALDAVVLEPSTSSSSTAFSSTAVAAGVAASSLILPQVTQALVGVAIGVTADELSSRIGTRTTRRALQLASGVIPAALLWYLSLGGRGDDGGDDAHDGDALASPAFLFGAAQTVSALSLGAVSVSHLDVASPSSAGAVYALGNVAAAASGSIVVNLFGRLLEDEDDQGAGEEAGPGDDGGGEEFALPFRVIAILSAVGSLVYGCTVETELEIGFNETTS